MKFQSIKFNLSSIDFILSYDTVISGDEDFHSINKEFNLSAFKGIEGKNEIYLNQNNNVSKFQIAENKTYYLKTTQNCNLETPMNNERDLKNTNFKRIVENLYTFNIQGFLGSSFFKVENSKIIFEIIPQKIGYDEDYKEMTKEISKVLSQLLQNWSAPTSLNFISDPKKYKKTLLEQFIFLKNFIDEENINVLFELIKRSPHQKLRHESEWMPNSRADYSNYLKDPLKNGRDWLFSSKLPSEIYSTRKYLSVDTPPNQFVKFALKQFSQICYDIIELFSSAQENNAVVISDVEYTLGAINIILSDQFFLDISDLDRIPFDNQTLQKRFGYREILNAWLMTQLALSVNWEGRESAYSASTRNVAKLYEYWLYFKLIECLEIKTGLQRIKIDTTEEALKYNENGILINLTEGKQSVLAYYYKSEQGYLRVHLYFNRTFVARQSKHVTGINSYSQQFRPDYTIVLFPKEYDSGPNDLIKMEEKASSEGRIAYLHFDAKYRVDKIKKLFEEEPNLDEEDSETKIKGVYKRGDLYKMHTYNDAIKRTVGSYVLYPGDVVQDKKTFEAYHEIIPGVGAFAVKPGNSLEILSKFIKDSFDVQSNKFSQLYRMQHDIHEVVKDVPLSLKKRINIPSIDTPPSEIKVALGYCRKEDLKELSERDFFYFHAIEKSNKVLEFPLDILQASILTIYTGNIKKKFAGLYGVIDSIKLKHRTQIEGVLKSNTEFYYYIKLKEKFKEIDLDSNIDVKNLFNSEFEFNSKLIKNFLPAVTTWDMIFKKVENRK